MKKKFTAVSLSALQPRPSPYYLSDVEQKGLRVRVAPSGTKSWSLAFRIKGLSGVKSVSLGPCDPQGKQGLGLAEARSRAAEIMKAARVGHNLLEEEAEARRAKDEQMSIKQLIADYAKSIKSTNRKGGALRSADAIERRLTRALEPKLTEAAGILSRADISKLLDPVSEEHPREAEARRQVVRAMYRWGITKGHVKDNPVDGTETYGEGEPGTRRLDPFEIKALWDWLDAGASDMSPDIISTLRLQLCLGCRNSEVGGMNASELAWSGDVLWWRLPATRSKNKKERFVPLIGLAREIVLAAHERRKTGPLFRTMNTGRALNSSDVGRALNNRTLPCASGFTTHDLRRTMVSEMDELGIPLDTIAVVIGHARGTRETRTLVKHYSRAVLDDRVADALAIWDRRLRSIIEGQAEELGDNVVMLRA